MKKQTKTPETVEQAAEKAGHIYYNQDKPTGTYTFHEGFKKGANWQSQHSYTESQVKLIATRFARESRLKQDITSDDTIRSFEAWFKPENFKH